MDRFINEIEAEKEQMETTLDALEEAMKRREMTIIELAAIATFLQNTYSGIENSLKRILKFKGISIPSSKSWHKDLLDLSVDKNIISKELSNKLNEYLAFRHFFTHGYGVKLEKEKLIPLAENLPTIWEDFNSEINTFIKTLNSNRKNILI